MKKPRKRANQFKFKVPGFRYPGSKVRLRKWLVSMMPRSGRKYVEPFVGRGNVFWLAACVLRFDEWHLNDSWTARWLEVIKTFDLGSLPLRLPPSMSLELRRRAFSDRDVDDLAVVLESKTMFSGGVAASGSSPTSVGNYRADAFGQTVRCARRLLSARDAKVTAKDWADMNLGKLRARDFVYLDPPYVGNDAGYAHDTVDHGKLLALLRRSRFRWMLSGYDTDLYREMIGTPSATKRQRQTMCFGGASHAKKKIRTECVWTNYDISCVKDR